MEARPPSVDALARRLAGSGLPHPVLVRLARDAVDRAPGSAHDVAAAAAASVARELLQPVVNATGVLLHTNLGRAPLAVARPAGYTNLELDLVTGRRGGRAPGLAELLGAATGAEAAIVVNNCAAAVLLALSALASGREVVVSRGESLEIGGGFRIPEILAQSGARLREVGTVNRTRVSDYLAAIGPDTALVLKVHRSNFSLHGFTESVEVEDLRGAGPPVLADLGSGLLDARCPWLPAGPPEWLRSEPAVRQTLAAGADLVTFSGDKLLGGPQAGIIVGRADLVDRCRRHPLARALRPGSLVLEPLQDVVLAYLRRDAGQAIPLWRMAGASSADLEARARAVGVGKVVACRSVMGGGTLPDATLPSVGIELPGDVAGRLRDATPPVIATVRDDRTVCDLRTVLPEQDPDLRAALHEVTPWCN